MALNKYLNIKTSTDKAEVLFYVRSLFFEDILRDIFLEHLVYATLPSSFAGSTGAPSIVVRDIR
jgi:hypothetical protein